MVIRPEFLVTHLMMTLEGSEELFSFPPYVVKGPEAQFEHRFGGETVHRSEAVPTIVRPDDVADLPAIPPPFKPDESDQTIAVVGPSYWKAAQRIAKDRIWSPRIVKEIDRGFFVISDEMYSLRMLRDEIAALALQHLEDTLRRFRAESWPTTCDDMLLLVLANPFQSLEDRLVARALSVRLNERIAYERVLAFDADELGVEPSELDRMVLAWVDRLVSGAGSSSRLAADIPQITALEDLEGLVDGTTALDLALAATDDLANSAGARIGEIAEEWDPLSADEELQ